MSYICATCGQSHHELPLSFAPDFPDRFANMTADDRENRAVIGSDQCIIDSEEFYIRGLLEIPIIGSEEKFLWGLWARIHEEVFDEFQDSWEQEGREDLHGPFKGRLANSLSAYPETLNLKLTIRVQRLGQRPLFFVDETDHQLAIAQARGMTREETSNLVSTLLHALVT
jgi:hypothetical protein